MVLEFVPYTGFCTVAPAVLLNVDEISPVRAAASVPRTTRVLVLAGSADHRATSEDFVAIANALGGQVEFVVINGGEHLRLVLADPELYRKTVHGLWENAQHPET